MRDKNSRDILYQILDELYGTAQALKDFCYVLGQLHESYPIADATEVKAVVDFCRTYVEAVEVKISEQLDELDETITKI